MALAGLLALPAFISSSHSAFGRTVTVEITLLSLNNRYGITVAGQLSIHLDRYKTTKFPFHPETILIASRHQHRYEKELLNYNHIKIFF